MRRDLALSREEADPGVFSLLEPSPVFMLREDFAQPLMLSPSHGYPLSLGNSSGALIC